MKQNLNRIFLLALIAGLSACGSGSGTAPLELVSNGHSDAPPVDSVLPSEGEPYSPPDFGAKSVVHSPFQLDLEKTSFDSLLASGWISSMGGELNQTLPDFSVNDVMWVGVSGIKLHLKYRFSPPAFDSATQKWQFSVKNLSAELNVDKVDANQLIHIKQDGADIVIRVTGDCKNVQMSLPESSSEANGAVKLDFVNGRPQLQLSSFASSWTPGAWKVASLECQGVNGFDKLVRQSAEEKLRSIDPFIVSIRGAIQEKLSKVLSKSLLAQIPVADNVSLHLYTDSILSKFSDNHILKINGEAYFVFDKVPLNRGCGLNIDRFTHEPAELDRGNTLSLPVEALRALMACAHVNGSLSTSLMSNKIPAFVDLQNSGMKKLFVWPDLNSFSNDAQFKVNVATSQAPRISDEQMVEKNLLSVAVDAPVELNLKAPVGRGQSYTPYISFRSNFSGPVGLFVSKGKVVAKIDSTMPLPVEAQWDPHYVAANHPNQSLALETLGSAAKDFLVQQGLTFSIPVLKISTGFG
ncbi:MAG: hypothetical protein ACXVBE_09905, partial [Bdellovibrionota bacterium]